MATFNKVNDFVANAVHQMDLRVGQDTLAVALSNTAPSAEASDPTTDGNGVLGNVTTVSLDNIATGTDANLTTSSSSQTGGTYKLVVEDKTITAEGGDIGPFRYVYIYNSTVAGNPLVGYYDYGLSLTLNDGDSFTLDFSATNGVIQIS